MIPCCIGNLPQIRRPSYGGRGLKLEEYLMEEWRIRSPLVWGAWIEIFELPPPPPALAVAPRMGGVD